MGMLLHRHLANKNTEAVKATEPIPPKVSEEQDKPKTEEKKSIKKK